MISNLSQIKEVPIDTVISRYTKLLKGDFACCPIHNEKSPSLKIYKKTNSFKCFGCGAGGDAITLVQKVESGDFFRAVEIVAGIGGITVEISETDKEALKERKEKQRNLQDTLTWALDQYALTLDQSEVAKDYLDQRGIAIETAHSFGLGFAPDGWGFLSDRIVGIQNPEHATALGLIAEKEKGGFYDRFRSRIIFPYHSHTDGSPVSLAGRTVLPPDQEKVKTLKGNNTPMYANGAYLFGLYQALEHIRRERYAIMVEGEMDVLQMHQAGARNTIGIGNNGFKEEQARLLKRMGVESLLFIPDHDIKDNDRNPGFDAFENNLKLSLTHGFRVELLELPAGMDPDDWAKQFLIQTEEIVET